MPSYKQAYEKAGGTAKLGDYASWEKKAKAWNQKKYGTTEPTAKASKMTGGSKPELAKAHSAASKPVQKKEDKTGGVYAEGTTMKVKAPTETKANERMAQAVASANAPESLLTGKAKRKAKRTEKRDRKSKSKSVNQNANIDTAMNKLNSSVDRYL